MGTPIDQYGFALPPAPLNFNPQPGEPFNDAVIKVGQLSFIEVDKARHWSEIMPIPDFESTLTPLPYIATGRKGFTGKSITEQRLIWERDASGFVQRCKERIRQQMALLEHEFKQNLEQAAVEKRPIAITPELIAAKWRGKYSMSMADFDRLTITAALIKTFWVEFVQKWKNDRGLPPKVQEQFKTFTNLFTHPDDIDLCIHALRNYRPEKTVLGEKLNWIGGPKDKSIIVGWIERMETTNKIHRLSDRKKLVTLLNQYFTNLDMGKDARIFDNPVKKDIQDEFIVLMSA